MSFIELYKLLENSASPNDTFKLIPALKFLQSQRCSLKLNEGSIFHQILSENYFHLKNVYNNEYLYVKQNKGKNKFIIKTISDSDSDKINWKFLAYEHVRSDRILLTIRNENIESKRLRALPCLVHDDEFILQMDNGQYYDNEMMNDAWNIEADDVASDRFRIKNDFTNAYLAVSVNNSNNRTNVILVNELNSENYDSAHWILEAIVEEI